MLERGNVIIIPDENKIIQSEYKKEIKKNHLEAFQDFSDKYNLGYRFNLDDYQEAPLNIANDGHFILKTVDDAKTVIFYIPKYVTDRQIEWIEYNKYTYQDYDMIGGYSITDSEEPEQIYGLLDIVKEMRKKNLKYKKEDDINVGKKI